MFRGQERRLKRVTLELGLKVFMQLDDESLQRACRTAFDNWRRLIEDAEAVKVMLWIGDGDEVFNWRGNLDEAFKWNDTIGFNNLKHNAYPESRHYRTWYARPYMASPPKVTYRDLKRIIETLRLTAKEMYGANITVGETIDAGPEFVESEFKFQRHQEILEGGPNSNFPKSLSFLCCYAKMKADNYPYAAFPKGLPEGTPFGTFLGKQFESLANAVGFDFVWFSNGFGLTHYAWNYLGEVYNGLEFHPERAPDSIRNFVSFWKAFRAECPKRPILIRGTNFSVGMDATAHGIDLREIYREGRLETPAPNPPWGSANLGLEMAAHLSRISSTPTRAIMFRFYINDSWFAVVPWYDYYNRETFDVYCPMSAGRLTETGAVETPTDFHVMTFNTGYGEMPKSQALEVEPHIRRAFDEAPDQAGPLVWVYPFSEYQDELHKPDGKVRKSFFGDWFIARAITAGLPLNTVVTTDNFAKLIQDQPEVFAGRVLVIPTPAADWAYAAKVVDFVKRGGQVILYGSLHESPPELLDLLNVKIDQPIDGDLDVTLRMVEDCFETKLRRRPLRHLSRGCDGGATEVLAHRKDKSTLVRATVAKGQERRVYALVRKLRSWKGGQVAWLRGSLPFDVAPNSLEPILFNPNESHDASLWMRYLLSDFGYDLRQKRRDAATRPAFLFAARSRGAYVISGHKPDATVALTLRFPDGAPIITERQAWVQDSAATYFFDRSFHHDCFAFVRQDKESFINYKEQRTLPTEMRAFRLAGLREAVVTLYVPREVIAGKKLRVRSVVEYTVQDPTSEDVAKKKLKVKDLGRLERDLKWKVDPVTGAAVVEKTTGTIEVRF